jgi:ABC-type phosphate/phosphonate transport system substrate-binding protein
LLTAPHLAGAAGQRVLLILKYANPVRGIVVVRTGSPLRTLQQLTGRRVATASPSR